jgi:NAD(P)H-nitrite reductase large subunit
MNYLIIGSSAAGIGAVEAIRKYDGQASITVVSEETTPLYSRCLLSYYLAGSVDVIGLAYRNADFFREMKVNALLGRRVESLNAARQSVLCHDGTEIDYDKLLIATGSSAKIPSMIPKGTNGVFVLRSLNDATAINSRISTAKHAVVVGGGLVGLKAAFGLKKRSLLVTVVVRSNYVLSQMIDYDAAQIVMKRLRDYGITVLMGSDLTTVQTNNNNLIGVTLEGKEKSLPCEILIAAKGVEANLQMLRGVEAQCGHGIITDSTQKTNLENVYAAGDVAETLDIATGERTVNALWTCAVQQGRTAGCNMAGNARQYDGSLGMNSINFPGVDLISFGIVKPPKSEDYEVLVDNRPETGIYKKIVLQGNRIKGMILVNKIDTAGLLLKLLRERSDVSNLKNELLSDHFSYATILAKQGQQEWTRYLTASRITGI